MENRAKKIRLACGGLSRIDLLILLGLNGKGISSNELKKLEMNPVGCSKRTIEAVASLFNVSKGYLLGETNARTSNEKFVDQIILYQSQFRDSLDDFNHLQMEFKNES